MRDVRKKMRRLKFKKQEHPIMVMQEDGKHFYKRYCYQVHLLEKFAYHNHWDHLWIVFHAASGLMIRKFKTEVEAQELAKRLEVTVKSEWLPSVLGLAAITKFMGDIKKTSGRNLQVCTESILGVQNGDVPW